MAGATLVWWRINASFILSSHLYWLEKTFWTNWYDNLFRLLGAQKFQQIFFWAYVIYLYIFPHTLSICSSEWFLFFKLFGRVMYSALLILIIYWRYECKSANLWTVAGPTILVCDGTFITIWTFTYYTYIRVRH